MTIAITQLAILTPLDTDGQSTWDALCANRRLSANSPVSDSLLVPDESPHFPLDRSIRLALAVARKIQIPEDTQLFCATSKGPAATLLAALDSLNRNQPLTPSQSLHTALGTGAIGPLLLHHLRPTNPTLHGGATSVAACAAGLHALHRAIRALQFGDCTRALVIAADSSLHPLFPASFSRLGVLAPQHPDAPPGTRYCTPFSPAGHGFILAESAAALLLEKGVKHPFPETPPRTNQLQKNGVKHPFPSPAQRPLAYITHSSLAADATSLIAIDPTTSALRHALHLSLPAPDSPLAFIHAHATGTSHDAHELAAIRSLFPDPTPVPPIFSHKFWLGHSLGAAGLLAAALSALSHHHRRTPANHPVPPNASSLTIAQGFGGHIATLALQSP